MDIKPIGVIRTPHQNLKDMPIQPRGAKGVKGEVIIDEAFVAGLADIDGFSHIYLLYHFHKARRVEMSVVPFMDKTERGVYSTRSPLRPNNIGISIVELEGVNGNKLSINNVDILDGTPLLDVKPYIKTFDHVEDCRSGWMEASGAEVDKKRSDDRFI